MEIYRLFTKIEDRNPEGYKIEDWKPGFLYTSKDAVDRKNPGIIWQDNGIGYREDGNVTVFFEISPVLVIE